MPTPDSSQAPHSAPLALSAGSPKVRSKPLPTLAPISIYASRHLVLLRAFLAALLALALIASLVSQFITTVGWTLLLVLAALVGATVWLTWRLGAVRAPEPLDRLWVEGGVWRLDSAKGGQRFALAGEVLLWPWVIIFELRPLAPGELSPSHKKRRMVILRDSMTEREFRALSRWLRLCVHKQAD